jgi:hypothetical protein
MKPTKTMINSNREKLSKFARIASVMLILIMCAGVSVMAFNYGVRLAQGALLNTIEKILIGVAIFSTASLSIRILGTYFKDKLQPSAHGQRRALQMLKSLIDLVPPPRLRKRLLKLLADQSAHVIQLRKKRRFVAAYWIVLTTWVLVAWYVLLSPIHAFWGVVVSPLRGAGD